MGCPTLACEFTGRFSQDMQIDTEHSIVMAEGEDRKVLMLLNVSFQPEHFEAQLQGCDRAITRSLTEREYERLALLIPELVG